MTEALVFAAIVASIGLQAHRILPRALGSSPGNRVLASTLGIVLALGASSATLFLAGLAFEGLGPGARWAELGVLALISGSLLLLSSRRAERDDPPTQAGSSVLLVRVLAVALAGMVILAGAHFVELTRLRPHGEWDAWAIWNGRAAFLSSIAGDWPGAALQINRGHGDYPLLLSLSVARFWAYLGAPSPLAPQALAFLYLGSLVALLVSALAVFRSASQGLLAGIVLLAATPIVEQATYQLADLPLAFHVLGACVLLVASDHATTQERSRLLAGAGLALGLAAWTKNEGLAFALAAPFAYLIAGLARDRRIATRELWAMLAGILPMAAVIALFKAGVAPSNDLVDRFQLESAISHLSDIGRLGAVLRAYGLELAWISGALLWLVPLYSLIVGTRLRAQVGVGAAAAALSVAVLGALTFLVYVTTPHDLEWHLATSCRRVLFQLWPSIVFLLFLGLATPEERSGGARGRF